MRNRFWSMYTETQFNYFYYWQYRNLSQKIDFWLRILATFATSAGVANLWIQENSPAAWLVIIAVSQMYQAFQFLLPFQERATRINYFLPPFQTLLNEIRLQWETIDSLTDEEVADIIYKFRNEYISLEQTYIGSYSFPHSGYCKKKADIALKEHFDYHYNFEGGE